MSNISFERKVTRNSSLDILKLIAAYMVVFIHFRFPGQTGVTIDALARFAVPVFFMSSGYFSYMNTIDKLKKKIIHILRLYLFGFVIYFCFYLVLNLYAKGIDGVISYIFSYLEIKAIVDFIVFNCPKFSVHLWFLCALIYVYIIQYFITKCRIKEKLYFTIAVCLLMIHIIVGEVFSFFGIIIPVYLVRNFLLMGYPFFCLGLMLRKKEAVILEKVSYTNITVMLSLGIFETLFSRLLCGKNELYFGSILIAVALFIAALKMCGKSYTATIKKLSETSTIIYLIHVMIGNCIKNVIPDNVIFWGFVLPVLICVFSTIAALLYNMILKNKKGIV